MNARIKPGANRARTTDLVSIITGALARVLGKNPAHTHVVVDEVPDKTGADPADSRMRSADGLR